MVCKTDNFGSVVIIVVVLMMIILMLFHVEKDVTFHDISGIMV